MEFLKTDETKVLRDPVHGYIHVNYKVIWDVINSAWFQRLRRIRQLGGAYMVYHCAEHTRFSHSLGVYEIVRRMVTENEFIAPYLSEEEKVTVMLAGLLHDAGHGPYSHAFEAVTKTSHETFTCRIIEEDTEITRILENTKPGLSKSVADVIRHEHPNFLLCQLISSQLDADRMDYLRRDAYFTGARYGEFDLERILRTLRVNDDNRLVVKDSGVFAVESYIMSRYHMYWQVYYHPVARSYEYLLHVLFRRLSDLEGAEEDPSVIDLLKPVISGKEIPLQSYFELDEYACNYGFACLVNHSDPVVRDLAERFRDRRLFEYTDQTDSSRRRIKRALEKHGLDPKYYLGKDTVAQRPYIPYMGNERDGSIFVLRSDQSVVELSMASNIVYSLIHGPSRDDRKIFYPGEIFEK